MGPRPTHFLSLPCAAVQGKIERIQRELLRHDPNLVPFIEACPMKRAHISVLMLYLPTDEMVQSAIQVFRRLADYLASLDGALSLKVGGLDVFNSGQVLFLCLDDASSCPIVNLQATVKAHFTSFLPEALNNDSRDFCPHITVAKKPYLKASSDNTARVGGSRAEVSPGSSSNMVPELIPEAAYKHLLPTAQTMALEQQFAVGEMHFCSMSWPTRAKSRMNRFEYYHIVDALPIGSTSVEREREREYVRGR